MTLSRLASSSESKREAMVKYHILRQLRRILMDSVGKNREGKYWALQLAHQLALSEYDTLQALLIKKGFIQLFAKLAKQYSGTSRFQKLALHSVVRLLASVEYSDVSSILEELEKFKFSYVVASALKCDDIELVCWAAFLFHEYAVKDFARSTFLETRGLVKALVRLLSHDDTCIPRIVIRALKNLSIDNPQFQDLLIKNGVTSRVVSFLRDSDSAYETQYWAVVFFHMLLANEKSHAEFMKANGLAAIINMTESSDSSSSPGKLYLADILISLAMNADNHKSIENSDIIDMVFSFLQDESSGVVNAGVTVLLNILTISSKIINQFYESGGVKLLCSMVLEHSEDSVRSVTAKALVIIARRSPEHRYYILTAAVMPLLRDTMQLISDCLRKNMAERGSATDRERDSNTEPSGSGNTVPLALTSDTTMSPDPVEAGLSMNMELTEHEKSVKMYQKMSTALVNLNTFLYTTIFDDGPDSEMVNFETMVGESLSGIAIGILDLHIMPLLKELSPTSTVPPNVELNVVADAAEDNSISVPTLDDVQVEGDAPSTTGTTQKDTATLTDNTKKDSATTTDGELTFEEQEEEIQAQKDAVTINAFKVISCLCRYEGSRAQFVHDHLASFCHAFLLQKRENISNEVIISLAKCLGYGYPKNDVILCATNAVEVILEHIRGTESIAARFHGEQLLHLLFDASPTAYLRKHTEDFEGTPDISVSLDGTRFRNDTWSFESTRLRKGVTKSGKYVFDLIVASLGIVQVGWVTDGFAFDAEAGQGVGDDAFSYSIDGHRAKKWHGLKPVDNSYGDYWEIGDVISVLINLDDAEMRFSRNGEDMGVAFAKFDTELEWFPAISLAVDQECELVFGPGLQKLSYVPEGYSPVFGNYHSSPGAHPERVPRHGSTSSDLLTEPSSISECLFSVRFVLPTEKSYFQIPVVGIEDIFSGALLLIGLFVSAQEDGTNDLKLRLFAVDVADDIDEALLQMDQKPTLSDDASSFVTPPSPSSSEEFFESVGEQSLSPESESSRFLCTTVPVVDIILPSQGIDNEQSDSATQPVRDLAENSSLAWVSRGTIECRYLEIEGRVYFTFNGSVIGAPVPWDASRRKDPVVRFIQHFDLQFDTEW